MDFVMEIAARFVNRFGVYEWNPQRKAPAINYGLPIMRTLGGIEA
jgi:hypothetical protein